jgi:hypothetical protein
MRAALAAIALLCPLLAGAGGFRAAELSSDQRQLVVTLRDGERFMAPSLPEQVKFDAPRISADGRHVGWLAYYDNCCTSYPIPLFLVVMDEDRHLHRFDGIQLAVFAWCFSKDSRAVAFRQAPLHFSNAEHHELRRIADERLLAQHDAPEGFDDDAQAQRRLPPWARCVPR